MQTGRSAQPAGNSSPGNRRKTGNLGRLVHCLLLSVKNCLRF